MRRNLILVLSVVVVTLAAASIVLNRPSPGSEILSAKGTSTTSTTVDPGPSPAEVDRWNQAVWEAELDRQEWNTAVWVLRTNQRTWIERTSARLAAEEAARKAQEAREAEQARQRQQERSQAPQGVPASEQGTGRCGGDLPPCYVMMRESGGDIRARNPSSTASGKWQFLDSTWAGFGGYARAYLAPESVQDAKARILWAGGRGCSHWSAC